MYVVERRGVGAAGQGYGGAGAEAVDLELLEMAAETAEEVLRIAQRTMRPEQKARLIRLLYEELGGEEEGRELDRGRILELVRMVA